MTPAPENVIDSAERLVRNLVLGMVDDPESVLIHRVRTEDETRFRVFVSAEDRTRIMGAEGRTLKALKTLVAAISAKSGYRITLELGEPMGDQC